MTLEYFPGMEPELESLLEDYTPYHRYGKPATYIPALSSADPLQTGIGICWEGGEQMHAGAWQKDFTIQSISKVLALVYVLSQHGLDYVAEKVGLEPAGESFNSLLLLELRNDPTLFNPLSNPGAMVVTSLIEGSTEQKTQRLLELLQKLTGRSEVSLDEEVYLSEKNTGHRNKAAAYLLKERDAIEGDPEEVLDFYFRQCAIKVNCRDLARMACVLGMDGNDPETGKNIIPGEVARTVRALMATYGMYNQSGSFAINIGLPAKSGVSGGIMAVAPRKMGIGIYNPAVNEKGNSVVGIKILEQLSQELHLSIY